MMRGRRAAALVVMLATVVALPCVVLAAEAEHGGEAVSPFSGNLGNIIWTFVIFLLVVFILGKAAWKPMLGALMQREKFIRDSLEAAQRDRESAEARLHEYEQRLQKAREEASGIVDESRRDGEVVRRRIEEEARRSGDEMIERAKREIGIARDTALKAIYDEAADLAVTLASGALKRQLSPEEQNRLVQDALMELKQRGPAGSN